MSSTTNREATKPPVELPAAGSVRWDFVQDLGFQMSLACLLVAGTFTLFRPEAETSQTHFQFVLLSGLGCALPLAYLVVIARTPILVKLPVLLTLSFLTWVAVIRSQSEFERTYQVLTPPELREGRFVHKALGLSYAKPPNFEANLVPRFLPGMNNRNQPAEDRLRNGARVLLNQMTLVRTPALRGSAPTMVSFEIANFHTVSLETFVRNIRGHEASWRSKPTARITRPTHGTRLAGRDLVEFEVLETRLNVTTRFAHLHQGNFLLTFVFTTTRDADRPLFNEFLKSIRFDLAE